MSADDRREELEAIIWRTRVVDQHAVMGILAAAERYKEAAVGEAITRMTTTQMTALGRAEAEEHRSRWPRTVNASLGGMR